MSTRGVKYRPPRVYSGRPVSAGCLWVITFSAMGHAPFVRYRLFLGHGGLLRRGVFALDSDLPRPGGLVLVQLELQHAVLEPGFDLVGVHVERQRQHAGEGAEAALLAVLHALLGGRGLALALDRELIVPGDVD